VSTLSTAKVVREAICRGCDGRGEVASEFLAPPYVCDLCDLCDGSGSEYLEFVGALGPTPTSTYRTVVVAM
jgi:hypothetical protein